jgi:acyl carrier protein
MTVRERIAAILSEILRERVDPAQEYTRERAPNWDSLNHLRIVLALEEEFGISLEPGEVLAVHSLSDLERIAQRSA